MSSLPSPPIERNHRDGNDSDGSAAASTREPKTPSAADVTAYVLIVDDDPDAAEMLADLIGLRGNRSLVARSGVEALALAQAHDDIALVLTDVQMAGMDGITLCQRLHDVIPDAPVIVLTGHGSIETVVRALRADAYDFHIRPIEPDLLMISVERALEHRRLRSEVRRLRDEVVRAQLPRALLGGSAPMREVLDLISRVASTDATVLVTGESGTGKELVARAVHDASPRRDGPFVAINCAAIPATLLESELFGHTRGAFTDARVARPGLFVDARGGTLFLDEIGEMPSEMQVKLLRALQQRTVRPVGGSAEVPFDARIVTATNRDLEDEVRAKRFREDLYYRVAVVGVPVPTLRERAEDIPLLAQHFVRRFSERFGKEVLGLAPQALQRLLAYPWPGNVRELENSMERAVALTRFDHVTLEDLPERVRAHEVEPTQALPALHEEMITLAELERRYVHQVFSMVGGNKSRAARILGVDRRTLYRIFDREKSPETAPPTG
jgi:DNA-binding NtrC family response regulator